MSQIADCPDCGRVELYEGRCPFCPRSGSLAAPGGLSVSQRRLPWLRKLKEVRPVASLQRRMEGFGKFRRKM